MKRLLCLCMLIVCVTLTTLSFSAFTPQSSRTYQSSDDTGAYSISFNGSHADITHYASDAVSVGLDLFYTISGVCAYRGKIVLFCDDTPNNQLVVYTYYMDNDVLDVFTINGAKLYSDTDFCCDDSAIILENHRDSKEVTAYSYNGSLIERYRFNDTVACMFNGYHSGTYVISDDNLYYRNGKTFSAITGGTVDYPLFSADSNVLVSEYGSVYVLDTNRITRAFSVGNDLKYACACVVGNRLYCSCGSFVNSYDIGTGEKTSYYRLSYAPTLLFADSGSIVTAGGSSFSAISPGSFTELSQQSDSDNFGGPDQTSGESVIIRGNTGDARSVSDISSDAYQIDFERGYISGITPETTVAQFKNNIRYSGWTVAVYKEDEYRKNGNIGTAMTAVFSSDNNSITFELSVSGDITGEGNRNSRDLNTLMDYLIGKVDFNGVYSLSADISGDGAVDVLDAALLKRMIG